MSVKKKVDVVYVAAIPDGLGIGNHVPAHVVLEWLDEQGRKHKRLLDFTPAQVNDIAAIENAEKNK